MTTKVIPAYPSKASCTHSIPEQVCVNVHNGQIDETGIRKLSLATAQSGTSTFGGLFGKLSGESAFGSANSLGEYIASNAGSTHYGSSGGYGSSGSVLGYGSSGNLGRYGSASSAGYSSDSVGGYGSTRYGYGSGYAGYGSLGYLGNEFGTSSGVEFIENDRSSCDDFPGDGMFKNT